MPTWRCPHCGTPQAETSRCWVCRRSSTSCATCANFRSAVVGSLGYCGLDRRRAPLVGDEIRPCWASPTMLVAESVPLPPVVDDPEHPFVSPVPEPGQIPADPPIRFWVELDG